MCLSVGPYKDGIDTLDMGRAGVVVEREISARKTAEIERLTAELAAERARREPAIDRERRTTRARAFLAVAFDCLMSAEHELLTVRPPLGRTANRLRRSVRWVAREAGKKPSNERKER